VFWFEFQLSHKQKQTRVGQCVSLTSIINSKDLGKKLEFM